MHNTNDVTLDAKVKLTKKGATHAPRPSAMGNHLNWQAVTSHKDIEKGVPVSVLVEAIKKGNPENQGNALPYLKYSVRNGNLALA